jgi:hypothetical protein
MKSALLKYHDFFDDLSMALYVATATKSNTCPIIDTILSRSGAAESPMRLLPKWQHLQVVEPFSVVVFVLGAALLLNAG